MKFKTLIIDDVKYARENLTFALLSFSNEIQIIGEANSVETARIAIEELKPDLIFLDINLGDGTGFDVLENLKFTDFKLVFLTAYDQYAIKALKVNAIDYLLKPMNILELKDVIQKIIRLEYKDTLRISNLLETVKDNKPKKIAIPSQDGISFYEIYEIIRCQSDGNYTNIYFTDKSKTLSSKTLKFFEETLEGLGFERIHNSHLINVKHVKKYINLDGGFLKMSDDVEVPISQRKKTYVLNLLENL